MSRVATTRSTAPVCNHARFPPGSALHASVHASSSSRVHHAPTYKKTGSEPARDSECRTEPIRPAIVRLSQERGASVLYGMIARATLATGTAIWLTPRTLEKLRRARRWCSCSAPAARSQRRRHRGDGRDCRGRVDTPCEGCPSLTRRPVGFRHRHGHGDPIRAASCRACARCAATRARTSLCSSVRTAACCASGIAASTIASVRVCPTTC
jgi:hypothetical protein